MIKDAIFTLSQGINLDLIQTEEVMAEIMSDKTTSAQIAAFLIALKMKGEGVEEIIGGTKGMLKKAVPIRTKRKDLVDLCGTGGDGSSTFNISTVSSFVTAGAGVGVAKHGNRSVSSRCGSADLLEALGFNLSLNPAKVAVSIDEFGYGFLFAPLFHPAMRFALRPRKDIGVRTLFNIIGPLVNPLKVKRQLLGVYSPDMLFPVSKALQMLGTERALVVHSLDGLDEISISAPTRGYFVGEDHMEEIEISPEDYNLEISPIENIKALSLAENVRVFMKILEGHSGPEKDIVLFNSGAALWIAGRAQDLQEGILRARDSIDSGKAMRLFTQILAFSRSENYG